VGYLTLRASLVQLTSGRIDRLSKSIKPPAIPLSSILLLEWTFSDMY
jgi:hypothetical protein